MIDVRSALPAGGSWRRLIVLAPALLVVAVACSDDSSAATEAPATEAPVATEAAATAVPAATGAPEAAASAASALDFGSGAGSITLGEETFEFTIGPGAGLCRDVFGIIQAGGSVAGDRDIEGQFSIPPEDWESFEDGRYDPPSVELEITSTGDDNARWIADASWAQEFDKVGMSQVDSYEKDGQTASGTATFANSWDPTDASVQGSFEISCAEG